MWEELLLLRDVAAVDGHRHEGGVTSDSSTGRKVNFEPQAITAGRPGHPTERWCFARRHSPISVQGDLKGDASTGGAEGRNVCH